MTDYNTWHLSQYLDRLDSEEQEQQAEDNEYNRLEHTLKQLLCDNGFEDVCESFEDSDIWINALTRKAQDNLNQSHCHF